MHYQQEQHGTNVLHSKQHVGVHDANGQFIPVDFQPVYDLLKDLNLAHHVSEEDKRFLRVY